MSSLSKQARRYALFLIVLFSFILRGTAHSQMSHSSQPDLAAPRFLTTQAASTHPDPTYLLKLERWRAERATHQPLHGLRWYAPDLQYRISARWIPSGMAGSLAVPYSLSEVRHESSPGMAEFTLYGQTVRLFPLLERPGTLLFLFRDVTGNSSTYGGGRLLSADLPSHGIARSGTLVLDFNRAENPLCAYDADVDCPLPPQQNRLTIPIPAGEQRPRN